MLRRRIFNFVLFFALAMSPVVYAQPRDIHQLVSQATEAARAHDFSKVVTLLNPYTDRLDDNAFLLLANSYSKLKDYKNEVRVLGLLSAKDPKNYRWYVLLGEAYRKQATQINRENHRDLYEQAITLAVQQFRKALQVDPKYKPAFDELLITLLKHHDNSEARDLILSGMEKYGQRPELLRELCRLDSNDGYVVQAIANCKLAIKLAPRYADNYVYLVQALHDQGNDQQAETQAVKAAEKFPRSEFVQWTAGKFFMKKKNYPVAARYFQTALNDHPSTRAHFGLAEALYNEGQPQQALPHYVIACKQDHKTLDDFFVAGSTLKQKGNTTLGALYTHKAELCEGAN